MRRITIIIMLAIGAATGCTVATQPHMHVPGTPAHKHAPMPKPVCVEARIVVHGDAETPCDLVPGQVLTNTGVTRVECDDMGGVFVEPNECDDVDF